MSKADARMQAVGDVDEANSAIGIALLNVPDEPVREMLSRIQNELFDLGADLATPEHVEGALRILPEQVARLEAEIDAMNERLQPLRSFVLPSGEGGAAQLHLARAIVRRAERSAVAARLSLVPRAYLNRLSDHLFVAARAVAASRGGDVLWEPGATRGADDSAGRP
jgi:cob(I)alamin adenosyltransferase